METMKKIVNNRYTYAQFIALPATVLSCIGFYKVIDGGSTIWSCMLILGLFLSLCAYCLGGLWTAVKSALGIAKWGWIAVPFPYDLVALPITFILALLIFFLAPIIPIRKAFKENG